MQKIIAQIAQEIRVQARQVQAAVELLDGGASVPFIARYRKEATEGLDDIQLAREAGLEPLADALFVNPGDYRFHGQVQTQRAGRTAIGSESGAARSTAMSSAFARLREAAP